MTTHPRAPVIFKLFLANSFLRAKFDFWRADLRENAGKWEKVGTRGRSLKSYAIILNRTENQTLLLLFGGFVTLLRSRRRRILRLGTSEVKGCGFPEGEHDFALPTRPRTANTALPLTHRVLFAKSKVSIEVSWYKKKCSWRELDAAGAARIG